MNITSGVQLFRHEGCLLHDRARNVNKRLVFIHFSGLGHLKLTP